MKNNNAKEEIEATPNSIRGLTLCMCLVVIVFASLTAFGHKGVFQCQVKTTDFSSDSGGKLGEFSLNAEKSSVTFRSYSFGDAGLFVNANVALVNSSTSSPSAKPTHIILVIALAKAQYSDIVSEARERDVVTIARSTTKLPFNRTASLETLYFGKHEPIFLELVCKE